MDRPPQVRAALSLLLIVLLIGNVGAVAAILLEPLPFESPDESRLVNATFGVYIAITVLYALRIDLSVSRRNWARLSLCGLIIILIVTTIVAYAIWPNGLDTDPWWVWLIDISTTCGEIVALALLFSRPAATWYRTPVGGAIKIAKRWSGPRQR